MAPLRLRALVLCAGRATRFRPLTTGVPKALLPVLGRPLLGVTLEQLLEAGVEAVAINLHHQGEAIASTLGSSYRGIPLRYSRENLLLGTLGAVNPLKEFLGEADLVLLVNGDSLCRWPIEAMVERHRSVESEATLLLSSVADVESFGGVGIDDNEQIVSFPGGPCSPRETRQLVFAGAHIFDPELLRRVRPGASDSVVDLYRPMVEAGGQLQAFVSDQQWHDLGNPHRYLKALLEWMRSTDGSSEDRSWFGRGASVDPAAQVVGSIIEAGATVAAGARLTECVVLNDAEVGVGAQLERCLLAPDVVLGRGTRVAGEMVTPFAWGLVDGSRRVGALVHTPLSGRA